MLIAKQLLIKNILTKLADLFKLLNNRHAFVILIAVELKHKTNQIIMMKVGVTNLSRELAVVRSNTTTPAIW